MTRLSIRPEARLACVCLAMCGLLIAGLPTAWPASNRAGARQPDAIAAKRFIYLPATFKLIGIPTAIAAAATARAGTARAQTATARPGTPSATLPTATPPTPGASASSPPNGTATPTASPSPTPSIPPTATRILTPSATPSPTAPMTPSITPTPRSPSTDERLLPVGALQAGTRTVTFNPANQTWRLRHTGGVTLAFEVDVNPAFGDVARGRLAVREVTSGRYPIAGAGLTYLKKNGDLIIDPRFVESTVTAFEAITVPEGIQITVNETIEGTPHAKRYTVRLVGRVLEVHAQSLDPAGPALGAYAGFTTGGIEGTTDGVGLRIPYMDAVPVTLLDHRWYVSTLLDYPRSHATGFSPRGPEADGGVFTNEVMANYEADTQGRTQPVDETVWVTLSPEVTDVFVQPGNPPSPHRQNLDARVHLTLDGSAPDAFFADEAAYVDQLTQWGVRDLIIHKAHWSDPNQPSPVHGPPDPQAGGSAEMASLVGAAQRMGALFLPAQAYSATVASCPTRPNPLYQPSDRVLSPDGQPKAFSSGTWPGQKCPDGSLAPVYLLPPDAAARIAADQQPRISSVYRGTWLDTLTALHPAYAWPGTQENGLDFAASSGHPTQTGAAILAYKRLFADFQQAGGPLFGSGASGAWESAYDTYYAGYVDGVSRALVTGSPEIPVGSPYLVVPDYELTMIRPRMANYGMGDYAQFFELPDSGTPSGASADSHQPVSGGRPDGSRARLPSRLDQAQIDEWRATVLSYGHAGSWTVRRPRLDGGDFLPVGEQVKEYFLMRSLQSRYLAAPSVSVSYFGADGVPVGLGEALVRDFDLASPRLQLSYGGAARLDLWINHGANVWNLDVGGQAYTLPQHGWLARSGTQFLAYSALVDGLRVDFLRSPELTLLDGRGRETFLGGLTSRYLKVTWPDGRVLEEDADGNLTMGP